MLTVRDALYDELLDQGGEPRPHARALVETQAWIEALLPGDGEPVWVPADPTNRTLGSERHVKIGHGRHYADVPPIKGVLRDPGGAALSASVKMTRADSSPLRS